MALTCPIWFDLNTWICYIYFVHFAAADFGEQFIARLRSCNCSFINCLFNAILFCILEVSEEECDKGVSILKDAIEVSSLGGPFRKNLSPTEVDFTTWPASCHRLASMLPNERNVIWIEMGKTVFLPWICTDPCCSSGAKQLELRMILKQIGIGMLKDTKVATKFGIHSDLHKLTKFSTFITFHIFDFCAPEMQRCRRHQRPPGLALAQTTWKLKNNSHRLTYILNTED